MQIPGSDAAGRDTRYFVAAEDTARHAERAGPLLEGSVGVEWYERPGSQVDHAALILCRLRRARAGEKGSPQHGDEAVRLVLTDSSHAALVWLASRAISYMDESGFAEAVEMWFPDDLDAS